MRVSTNRIHWILVALVLVIGGIFFRLYPLVTSSRTAGSSVEKSGKIYLLSEDSYYYLSLTEKILKTGIAYEKIRGREYFNSLMLAPSGAWYPRDVHPYVGYWAYRLISFFHKNISLENAVSCVAPSCAVVGVLFFLILIRNFFSLPAGCAFLGGAYMVFSPVYLSKSLFGTYDTDPYNVLFPMFVLFGLLGAFDEKKYFKIRCFCLALAIIAAAVHSFFWRGWLLSHCLFVIAMIPVIFLRWRNGFAFLAYALGPIILVMAFWGIDGLTDFLKEGLRLAHYFFNRSSNYSPDFFSTVGELRALGIADGIRASGGGLIYGLALYGIVKEFPKPGAFILLGLLVLTTLLGAQMARFTLLATVPIAVGVALGIGRVKYLKFLLIVALTSLMVVQAHTTAWAERAVFNASWGRIMKILREKTPPDSIVTTEWSFGHFVTSQGKRRVTVDGATQDTPQAYWVARMFMESSEENALLILKTLNTLSKTAAAPASYLLVCSDMVPMLPTVDRFSRWRNNVASDDDEKGTADNRIARSLFCRLYYSKGKGLAFLKLFAEEENVRNKTRIYLYEVNWQRYNAFTKEGVK